MELGLIMHGSRGRNALGKMTDLFMWLKFLNQILKSKWRSSIILPYKHIDYVIHCLKVFIIFTYLTQQFSMEIFFATQGTLGILGCESWWVLLASSGQRPGLLLTFHIVQDRPHNRVIPAKMSLVVRLTISD